MKQNIRLIPVLILFLVSCGDPVIGTDRDFKQDMRNFIQGLSAYARGIDPDFIIIPQNGHNILTDNGEQNGSPAADYLAVIDGVGREDLFYGYDQDDMATETAVSDRITWFMDLAESEAVQVLVTDYCTTPAFMDDSYARNGERGYISFAASHRELDNIPDYPAAPYHVNSDNILSLGEAQNFLYLLNPGSYDTKTTFTAAIGTTNYDLVITDLFYEGTEEFTPAETASLKVKNNGSTRLVIAYMSIGEAEDYRYYWQWSWGLFPPSWLSDENEDWEGNYKVHYWDQDWQEIIYGNDDSYLKKILDAGFDGVYLDIIDAFEYFEG